MKKIFTLIFVSTILNLQVFSQKPNFSGTWQLNLNKSNLENKPAGLTSSVFIIKQEGDVFRLTRYHISGEKKRKISFKLKADGKTRRIKLFFRGKLEWKDNTLQASLWNKGFSNIVTYKFGKDTNEFIADEVYKGRPQDHHNIWIFDKESVK